MHCHSRKLSNEVLYDDYLFLTMLNFDPKYDTQWVNFWTSDLFHSVSG